ncbi:hypothetical protein [Methylobacterium sp. Leaf108]|uniref:hypothetical protein n=1 Tax=Methylobacterium sp. Leaf108 TaxID=1736256 RepID=UPI0006FD7D97|nr:hypothetical protein [Methylobacterium sp. Leaf108]KQP48912.1 hypothetical protein ASF39_14215 [Methylobacterium sp. Leaf108]
MAKAGPTTGDAARDVRADAATLLLPYSLYFMVAALLIPHYGLSAQHAVRRLLSDVTTVLTSPNRQTFDTYVTSQRFRTTPGMLSRALVDLQEFKPALDLQQPSFVAVELDLRPHANSAMRVCSADGHVEERRPLQTAHRSPYHLTVSTADEPEHGGHDSTLLLSFILEPIHCSGRRLETRLTIATRLIPEFWWSPTIPNELAALTEWWLHQLNLHLATA